MSSQVRRFIYNSDYPEVYIAKVFEKDFLVTADEYGGNGELHFNHGLPFTPLMRGVWSDESHFSWSNDLSVMSKIRFGNMPEVALTCSADNQQIHLIGTNNTYPFRNFRIYVKIICLVPPDYNGSLEAFDVAGKFKFNSDKKYNKLLESGILPAAGGVVSHNLGYIPIVWAFSGANGVNGVGIEVRVDQAKMQVINLDQYSQKPIYYYIFGDSYED